MQQITHTCKLLEQSERPAHTLQSYTRIGREWPASSMQVVSSHCSTRRKYGSQDGLRRHHIRERGVWSGKRRHLILRVAIPGLVCLRLSGHREAPRQPEEGRGCDYCAATLTQRMVAPSVVTQLMRSPARMFSPKRTTTLSSTPLPRIQLPLVSTWVQVSVWL